MEIGFVLMVVYIQLGLLLLGGFFCRKLAALRVRALALEANHEAAARRLDALLNGLGERVRQMERSPRRGRRMLAAPVQSSAEIQQALGAGHQRVEMLNVAHALNMRWAEVDLLVRVHNMRKAQAKTWELAPWGEVDSPHAAPRLVQGGGESSEAAPLQ